MSEPKWKAKYTASQEALTEILTEHRKLGEENDRLRDVCSRVAADIDRIWLDDPHAGRSLVAASKRLRKAVAIIPGEK